MQVPEDSLWAGKTLSDLQLGSRFGIHVSSILRGRQRLNIPGGNTVIFPGDKLQVIGGDDQLTLLHQSMEREVQPDDPAIEQRETRLRQVVLTGSSPLIGLSLKDSGIRDRFGCMVVGFEEGKENLTAPSPAHVFKKGDIFWVVGEESDIRRLVHSS